MGTFLSLQLEQEYNITIPRSDAKKLTTDGNAVDYIERREDRTSRRRSRQRRIEVRCYALANLEPRIDGLALQCQDAEDAFVSQPQWLLPDEALQRLDT